MSTYTQILYQIVYSTKNRQATLTALNREELHKYIYGVLKEQNCFPYQIGGVEDHIHIVTHLHPKVALADLIKDIKLASTDTIKERKLFQNFNGWQDGYAAFTYSIDALDRLIDYVRNQEEHHKTKSFIDELIELLEEHGVRYDTKYLL